MAEERREVEITIKVQVDGFGADVTAHCQVDHIPGLVARLREAGVTPANSPYVWEGQPVRDFAQADRTGNGGGNGAASNAPICPVHGTPMRPSSKGNGYYCPKKVEDGGYCRAKAVA